MSQTMESQLRVMIGKVDIPSVSSLSVVVCYEMMKTYLWVVYNFETQYNNFTQGQNACSFL